MREVPVRVPIGLLVIRSISVKDFLSLWKQMTGYTPRQVSNLLITIHDLRTSLDAKTSEAQNP
jgi:hypothetical protein